MKLIQKLCTALVVLAVAIAPLRGAGLTALHHFTGTDGGGPYYGKLVMSGTVLYGMTYLGGSGSAGVIFKVDTDGTDYAVLHNFTGTTTTSDGASPYGSLTLIGSTLYGMTSVGGSSIKGTIFKIDTDGNNFGLVHEFTGESSDGAYPHGDLLLVGSTFYGMTDFGGSSNKGVIFKVDTNGGNFAVLHSFAGGTTDGQTIYGGSLVTDGTYLYGMSCGGGAASHGTVFKLKIADSSFSIVHSFAGATSDGEAPYGQLLLSGSTLYGLTYSGGTDTTKGTIFKVDTSGDNYVVLRSFGGSSNSDGERPMATLALSGSRLFGTTGYGGSYGEGGSPTGTIFGIDTDGSNYLSAWVFRNGTANLGMVPLGTLLIDGNTAYGMTSGGGASGYGTIFSFDTTTPADIAISKWSDNSTPLGGTNITYTVQATNYGPATATGVQVTDVLPAQVTYISNSPSQGTYDTSTGVWDVGSLAKDASATLGLTVKVIVSGSISNTATKTAETEPDSNTGNDSSTSNITTAQTKNLLPPILGTPASGATGMPTSVLLKWMDTNNYPQEVKYKVRIKKAGGSYVNVALPAGTQSYTKSNLTPGKVYYWNVMAVGNGTTTRNSAWANGGVDFRFTVAPPVTLTPPTLLTPASGATGQSLSPTLYWGDTNSSPNELHYKVRFKIAGGAYTVTTLGPDVTSLAKTGLRSGKTYYWSVMAVGNGTTIKNSVWPADYRFTTGIITLK